MLNSTQKGRVLPVDVLGMRREADDPPPHLQGGAVCRGLRLPPGTAAPAAQAPGHALPSAPPAVKGVEVFEDAVKGTGHTGTGQDIIYIWIHLANGPPQWQ